MLAADLLSAGGQNGSEMCSVDKGKKVGNLKELIPPGTACSKKKQGTRTPINTGPLEKLLMIHQLWLWKLGSSKSLKQPREVSEL